MKPPKKTTAKEIKASSVEMEIINSRLEFLELQLSMITRCVGELHKIVKTKENSKERLGTL